MQTHEYNLMVVHDIMNTNIIAWISWSSAENILKIYFSSVIHNYRTNFPDTKLELINKGIC